MPRRHGRSWAWTSARSRPSSRLAARAAGVETFLVGGEEIFGERLFARCEAGGDGEPADEVGVDAFAFLGAALGGVWAESSNAGFRTRCARTAIDRFAALRKKLPAA